MERPFILEYKRQQYGAWFSKRGSVDLCFPSETLSLVYIDNGDWVKCAECFTFCRISEFHPFTSASSATLMMRIVLCSSKFHVKCISVLTTWGLVSPGRALVSSFLMWHIFNLQNISSYHKSWSFFMKQDKGVWSTEIHSVTYDTLNHFLWPRETFSNMF